MPRGLVVVAGAAAVSLRGFIRDTALAICVTTTTSTICICLNNYLYFFAYHRHKIKQFVIKIPPCFAKNVRFGGSRRPEGTDENLSLLHSARHRLCFSKILWKFLHSTMKLLIIIINWNSSSIGLICWLSGNDKARVGWGAREPYHIVILNILVV